MDGETLLQYVSNFIKNLNLTYTDMSNLSKIFIIKFNTFFYSLFSIKTLKPLFNFFIENILLFLITFFVLCTIGNFLIRVVESEKQEKQFDNRAFQVLGIKIEKKKDSNQIKNNLLLKNNVLENKILLEFFSGQNAKRLMEIKLDIIHAGLPLTLVHFFIFGFSASCLLYYIIFLFDVIDPLLLSLLSIFLGFYGTSESIKIFAQSRIKKMRIIFPEALDSMNRSLKTGFDIEQSILLISKANLNEISLEFEKIYKRINIGVPAANAVSEAIDRIPIEEFKFFAVALKVHNEAGGNLTELISNLATVVRKRHELEMKVQTLSSEARMSAKILLSLPVMLGGIFFWMNNNHFDPFFQPGTGKILFFVALSLYFTGAVVIKKVSVIKA